MYPPELEKLIEAALMDGELTEKEKQILFKKATSLGIDLDEFEMVLNARLYEKQQSMKKVSDTPPPPKSNKYGEVKKCPNCGAILQSFQEKCADCGIEFRNAEANQSVKTLTEQLNIVEADIIKEYADKYKKMTSEREEKKQKEILDKQAEIIKHFPIPSTKEDVLELLFYIAPKAKEKYSKKQVAWATKYNEMLMKSKILFANDTEILAQIKKYEKERPSGFSLLISRYNALSSEAKFLVFFIFLFIFSFLILGILAILN